MGNAPHKLFQGGKDDMPIDVIEKPYYAKIVKNKEDMTGSERMRALFSNEDGQYTPEMSACFDSMLLSFFASGTFGGVARSRAAYQDFFRSYGHETFETPSRARMLLQEKVLVAFGTGFWRVSWRVTLFTGMFMLATTCATAYRGKYGPISCSAGGATAGMLYKFREGPKATIAGVVVGAGLGLIGGALTAGLFKASGMSYDTIMAFEYRRRAEETEKTIQAMHEARNELQKAHSLSEFQDALLNETTSKDGTTTGPSQSSSAGANSNSKDSQKVITSPSASSPSQKNVH